MSLPNTLEVNPEKKKRKKKMEHTKDITLRSEEEIEEPLKVEEVEEVDANELDELVEEETTSLKPNEMRKRVVETIPNMTLWGKVHKELEDEKISPITEVDKFIF